MSVDAELLAQFFGALPDLAELGLAGRHHFSDRDDRLVDEKNGDGDAAHLLWADVHLHIVVLTVEPVVLHSGHRPRHRRRDGTTGRRAYQDGTRGSCAVTGQQVVPVSYTHLTL